MVHWVCFDNCGTHEIQRARCIGKRRGSGRAAFEGGRSSSLRGFRSMAGLGFVGERVGGTWRILLKKETTLERLRMEESSERRRESSCKGKLEVGQTSRKRRRERGV